MSQSFWEPETMEEAQPELEVEQPELEAQESAAEPEAVSLSVDDFSALEERILRAVNLVKQERLARAEADQRVAAVEAQLREQGPLAEQLQTEVSALRAERDHVRQRVERLLAQLDALEL
jgi:PHD/YefM family antitoxin component YafN of YafNO toxin-antitoxin module